jgi:hypothetical protein
MVRAVVINDVWITGTVGRQITPRSFTGWGNTPGMPDGMTFAVCRSGDAGDRQKTGAVTRGSALAIFTSPRRPRKSPGAVPLYHTGPATAPAPAAMRCRPGQRTRYRFVGVNKMIRQRPLVSIS